MLCLQSHVCRLRGLREPQFVQRAPPPLHRFQTSAPRPSLLICNSVSKRRSYYEILGVEQTAASEEIRAAYRSLAKAFHPDVSQEEDSHEVFAEINSAYAVLSDPEQRGRYDHLWQYEQARMDAASGDPDRPLSPEEAERAAALDKLEEVHREAERARRLAKEARRAAERAKRQAAAQAREVKRQAAAAAAEAAAAVGTAAAASAGSAAASSDRQPASAAAKAAGAKATRVAGWRSAEPAQGPAAEREARRVAREAAQAAKRQAREARRHASQVRYWAQWAEHEVKTVRQTAGLEPVPSSPEEQLLWEWQQLQARQQQQEQQQQAGQRQQGPHARRAQQRGAARGPDAGSGGWEPPAAPPE